MTIQHVLIYNVEKFKMQDQPTDYLDNFYDPEISRYLIIIDFIQVILYLQEAEQCVELKKV